MNVFLVERYLAGWSREEMDELVEQIRDRRDRLGALHVRHVSSILLPDEETCLCLFDADDSTTVCAANAEAGLPFDRVVLGELFTP